MARFIKEKEQDDGWSRWVPPRMKGYKLACCDCGLAHVMDFQVVKVTRRWDDGAWEHGKPLDPEKYRVLFRAKRDNRSTGQLRRKK